MADCQDSLSDPMSNQADDIRLLILDIDGTIAGESNEIRPAVLEAVKAVRERGIQVAIATGRMYCSAVRFHEALGLSLPIMAYQGALMKDPQTQTVHRHWPVSRALATRLLDDLERSEQTAQISVHFYIDDQLYVRDLTPETIEYAERSGVKPIAVGDLRSVLHRDTTKILALSPDPDLISSMLSSFRQQYTPAELYFTKSVSTFFEAANPNVNKGVAVQAMTEDMLNLTASNVMAIGDNFNDVEMLRYSGIGIAMGNAPEEVQANADWVTEDVEADGVAIALEKFLL
ncbi:MAG: Cof-type HAD-IIB family hydrolase [Cyanobacteria bacterium J06633_2]